MNEVERVQGEFARGYRQAIKQLMDEAMGEADMDAHDHFYVRLSFLMTTAERLVKEVLG